MTPADRRFMALALSLGARGLGRVGPWPSVGCVIVRDGRIVGRGTSDRATMRHAEIVALHQAGEKARGATAYVSLEPCSHHGATPPCADALIGAGIARVVSALEDPNPLVAGQGHDRLRAAGIEVLTGVMEAEAHRAHRGFLTGLAEGRPMVTLKLASSLDGRIATATGESQWITGPPARRSVHAMRLRHDAVMVGGGTARADDPSLTVRDLGAAWQPTRVVLSRRLDLPRGALWETAADVPVWLVHGPDAAQADRAAWEGQGARLFEVSATGRQIDPRAALEALHAAGINRVFCEGGGSLAASLLSADCVDVIVGFTAGIAIGAEGLPSLAALGLDSLSDAPGFDLTDLQRIGPDILHVWERR